MKGKYLSTLANAGPGAIAYYVGDDVKDVSHLRDCTLICKHGFEPKLPAVNVVHVNNPQLQFYKLSVLFKEDYLDRKNLIYSSSTKAYIHKDALIGKGVNIGPGSVIGNAIINDGVEIHANVVIYAKTLVLKNAIIQSNTTIGGEGVMWVWHKNKRVYLHQTGNVRIGEGCIIGTQCAIVRGSANEATIIDDGTCIAHGTNIGHGTYIGKYNHLANGVLTGGSCSTSDYNFFGSGSIINAGVKVQASNVVVGAGAVVTRNITEDGVYVGCPAKRIKSTECKLSGVPKSRNGI